MSISSIYETDVEQKTGYISPAPEELRRSMLSRDMIQAFQYWPAEISDSRQPGWNFDSVPGSSHPNAYWSNGGERQISFTAQFSRDINGTTTPLDVMSGNIPTEMKDDPKHNPDLRAVAKWLRWYTFPIYETNGRVLPPPKALLVFPGLQLGHDGSDELLVVMTSCDITWKSFWPDGSAKRMDASLGFTEIVQQDGKIVWQGRDQPKKSADVWGAQDYKMNIVK